ncbi:energy-coupling factor transporter ATPase [Bacillus tianshenii]|nr:energy-coupling factor transporter ATPase [Bacillus tianshenii]
MEQIKVNHLNFTYPKETVPAISNVSLSIKQGEFILLCGPSGCGKTSLLRHLKKEIQPVGDLSGQIYYDQIQLEQHPEEKLAAEIGMVFQDPESQIVMDNVAQELAFSLENLGIPSQVIRQRIAEMVNFFGIHHLFHKSVHELSGGQKQWVNLASVLVMQPKVLLLDEPTSQLDPVAAKEFLQMIYRINQEFSTTIVMSEHRLEEITPLADKMIMMDQGKIKYEGEPKKVIKEIYRNRDEEAFLYLPSISKLFINVIGSSSEVPITVKEGRRWISSDEIELVKANETKLEQKKTPGILKSEEVTFQYRKHAPSVLNKLSLTIFEGELLSIVGGNGAGKSTLLQTLAGLLKPIRGSIYFKGKKLKKISPRERYKQIGYLPQNPKLYFVHDTVEEELLHVGRIVEAANMKTEVERYANLFQVEHLLRRHPHDCSGGEQQKVALISLLLSNPDVILVDEPTKGLDPYAKEQFAKVLKELNHNGMTIVMVTHDIEFAAEHSTRCALLFNGEIISEDVPEEFFQHHYYYTTSINRIFREIIPGALTYKDVIAKCSVTV